MQDPRSIIMQELKQAIKQKNMQRIKQILSLPNAQQIVNFPDKEKQTALFHTCLHQDQQFALQVLNLLLSHGADPFHRQQNNQTVIFYLASHNKNKILERILELGFNLNQGDQFGWTPLCFAASKGRNKCAQLLIKNGNNVNQLDNNGQTCLFWAAKQGHLQMCKQLINRGCDPLVVDKSKKTAATLARAGNHYHVVEYLNLFKKQKIQIQKGKSNSESMQIEKKSIKKKEMPKSQYKLAYTASNGQTKFLRVEQMEEFLKKNNKIKLCLQDPQQLQKIQAPQDHIFKKCNKLLTTLLKRKDTIDFHQPVKWQQLKLLDYPSIIPHPMDYSTMKSKLMYNCYKSPQDFTHDIHLIYDNCFKYNGPDSVYGKLAEKLKQEYDHQTVKEFNFFDD